MSKHTVRRRLAEIQHESRERNRFVQPILDGFKYFAKLRRKQYRHRLATEPRCPTRLVTDSGVYACQLPNGHEGLCLGLGGFALCAVEYINTCPFAGRQ